MHYSELYLHRVLRWGKSSTKWKTRQVYCFGKKNCLDVSGSPGRVSAFVTLNCERKSTNMSPTKTRVAFHQRMHCINEHAGCRAQTDMWKLLPPPSAIIIWILQYHMANTNQHFASMDLKSWLSLLCVVCFRFHHHFDNIGLCLSNSTVTALCAEFPPTQQNAWAASFIVLIYWFFTPKICK